MKIALFVCCLTLPLIGGEMTLEEKVGQLLIAHFQGEHINEEANILVHEVGVGGIIYYEWANGLKSPSQVQALSNALQGAASIPLFISVDQEGGLVARLRTGFTLFPGNRALRETQDGHLAESCAYAMAEEMQAVGVNLDFAPVVDINSNPRNPVIGIRAFGDSPEVVVQFAKNAMEGYRRGHVLSTLKHFPGHGDVAVDSHEVLPVVPKTKQELLREELYPYYKLHERADMIMTGHVLVPALDSSNCATFSRAILKDCLRKEIGFKGVVISDSLVMEGLLKTCPSIEEVAIRAFNAGCDILLLGGRQLAGAHAGYELKAKDVQKIHRALVNAVKNGTISEQAVDASVGRILKLKRERGLFQAAVPKKNKLGDRVKTLAHEELAKKVAQQSVKVVKEARNLLPLSNKKVALFAPSNMSDSVEQSALASLADQGVCFFTPAAPTKEEKAQTLQLAKQAEVLLLCSFNAWKFPGQEALLKSLLDLGKPCIVIALCDPIDQTLFAEAKGIITTFSPTLPSLQVAASKLEDSSAIEKIADKIWQNECAGTIEGLTHGGKNENFASLGIGHFIWYPAREKKIFQETFPELLQFLKSKGVSVPTWLLQARFCPWSSREAFYKADSRIIELRTFLYETRKWQALFMAKRLENALPRMTENLSARDKKHVKTAFDALASEPRGLYALLDYLNFKGEGTAELERYKGQGWGLVQVLLKMPSPSIENFAEAARALLTQRVQNAPTEKGEERWLKGWLNRINTYAN